MLTYTFSDLFSRIFRPEVNWKWKIKLKTFSSGCKNYWMQCSTVIVHKDHLSNCNMILTWKSEKREPIIYFIYHNITSMSSHVSFPCHPKWQHFRWLEIHSSEFMWIFDFNAHNFIKPFVVLLYNVQLKSSHVVKSRMCA